MKCVKYNVLLIVMFTLCRNDTFTNVFCNFDIFIGLSVIER